MSNLTWPEKPNCSNGHPCSDADEHSWVPATNDIPPGDQSWVPFRTCYFCGGMHPEDMLNVLNDERSKCLTVAEYQTLIRDGDPITLPERLPDILLEWADFKYGWPHKVYVRYYDGSHRWGKFYTKHLLECEGEAFDVLAKRLAEKTEVFFERLGNGKIRWRVLGLGPEN